MSIGSIIIYPSATVPEGYLLCDGTAVSRAEYSDLFDVIGTTYGVGDGSTTFNLPNLSGRVAIDKSSTHDLGTSGGETTHTLTTTEIAQHAHTIPAHGHGNSITATTPKFTHSITQAVFKYTKLNGASSTASFGTAASGYSGTSSASMSRSTNLAVSAHAAESCTMSGGITDCAAMTSGSEGDGGAHNNMMPYLALTYLICYAPDTPPRPKMVYYNGALPVGPLGGYICGMAR